MSSMNPLLPELRKIITDRTELEEIQTICFDLRVAYSELKGTTKTEKVMALLLFLDQRQRLDELMDLLNKTRPDIDLSQVTGNSSYPTDYTPSKDNPSGLKETENTGRVSVQLLGFDWIYEGKIVGGNLIISESGRQIVRLDEVWRYKDLNFDLEPGEYKLVASYDYSIYLWSTVNINGRFRDFSPTDIEKRSEELVISVNPKLNVSLICQFYVGGWFSSRRLELKLPQK
jgi:hypothetical protein